MAMDHRAGAGAGSVARRRGLLVALGACVVVAAVIAGVAATRPSPRGSGHPPLHGIDRTAPLTVQRRGVPGFVTVSRDGRTLSTFGAHGPCGEPLFARLVATERARTVALSMWVKGPHYTKAELAHMICTTMLMSDPYPLPTVTLAAPLGERTLVEARSGRTIPSFGGPQLARPTVLPARCVPGRLTPAFDVVANGSFRPRGPHPGATWECTFVVHDPNARRVRSDLRVGQWAGAIGGLGLHLERRVTVHGHVALIKVDRYAPSLTAVRAISWREGGYTFIISSSTDAQGSQRTGGALSAATLHEIAEGLVVR